MNKRIQANPDHYQFIKETAKTDRDFIPYLEWYEMRRESVPAYQQRVKKLIKEVMGHTKGKSHFRYRDIAEIAGCSQATISKVMVGNQGVSEEMARNVAENLTKYMEGELEMEEAE